MTEESKIMIFNQTLISQVDLRSNPEEELGLDWDIHADSIVKGDLYCDAGLVNIDQLIDTLTEMRSKGATHAACDWHCDHQELEVYGVKFELASEEERQAHFDRVKERDQKKKEMEIKALEHKLAKLKGE